MPERKSVRILFLCTGNSCRSQMAEAFANQLKKGQVIAFSAGVETHGVNPFAIMAMEEVGIDISTNRSKLVDEFLGQEMDWVVTVCQSAHQSCPVFPGKAKVVHVGFDDPPVVAAHAKTQDDAMVHYRRVRDEIQAFVEKLPDALESMYNA